ncbi:ABC transporter ATP-binding protein [Desulfurococcus amylolyticus]|uniref:ABC transporter ATP-binding protein n=1 Tax=Desulfurococcus amylolyticus TaxID=94694 RepID=UPI0023F571BB|nr:ABC transporter ATP-binding protein [Desulfurococcus amylolyticus]
MVVIRVANVDVRYNCIRALQDISIDIYEGEVVAVVGPNGSGKTTLLKTVDGILRPTKGSVYIDMKNILTIPRREVAKKISLVTQFTYVAPGVKVIDFVLTGRRPHIDFAPTRRDLEISISALSAVRADSLAERDLTELSSGEFQRVLIARALAAEPKVLLLDEPTSNLDLLFQIEILNLIKSLSVDRRLTVMMSLHDLTQAYRFSDKVIILKNGRVYAVGEPDKVLNEEIIEKVYGVKVRINKDLKAVIPLV